MPLTTYQRQAFVNHFFRNQPVASPAVVYVALHVTVTGDDGSGQEMTGGSYARQPVTFEAPSAAGSTQNATTAQWEDLPAGSVVAVAVWDAPVGGNMLAQDELSGPEIVVAGQSLAIPVGDLDLIPFAAAA